MERFRTYGAGTPLLSMSPRFSGSLEPWKGKRKPPRCWHTKSGRNGLTLGGRFYPFRIIAHSCADFKKAVI